MVCEIIHPKLGRISSPINPKQPQNLPIFLPPKPPGSSKFFLQTFEAFVSWSVPDTIVVEHRFNPAWGGGNTKLSEGFLLKTCSFEGREVFFFLKSGKNRKSYIHNYIWRAMTWRVFFFNRRRIMISWQVWHGYPRLIHSPRFASTIIHTESVWAHSLGILAHRNWEWFHGT